MIKCNATVCGTINSSAEEKQSNNGEKFISFSMVIALQGKDGTAREQYVSVSAPGDKETAAAYTTGRKVTVTGILYFRKHDGNLYLNLRTDGKIEINDSTVIDRLEGSMEFKGKISNKGIKEFTSKKGKPMQSFSAFSSDKEGDNREFTWVNFIVFTPIHADYFAGEKYVEVNGDLQVDIFKGNLQLECKVKSVAPWELANNNQQNGAQSQQ